MDVTNDGSNNAKFSVTRLDEHESDSPDIDFDHLVVKISDLEEMYGDMVQLNEIRLANSNTW